MSITWQTTENALAAWAAGAGVPIQWTHQGAPYGTYPFLSLNAILLEPVGSTPEVIETYDRTRALGQEIEVKVRAQHVLTLNVQAYTDSANVIGQNSSLALLARVSTRLGLPTVREALRAGGLGALRPGAIVDLTELFETGYESRASCDFRFMVAETASDYIGYFSTVKGTLSLQPGGTQIPYQMVVSDGALSSTLAPCVLSATGTVT